jgi:hypothetical protein
LSSGYLDDFFEKPLDDFEWPAIIMAYEDPCCW